MKLVIISHTEHYTSPEGTAMGWGPTVKELNHLAEAFELIYHIAPLHKGEPPPSSRPYTDNRIKYVPISPTGGKSLLDKAGILLQMPQTLGVIRKYLKKADVFQFRAPTGIGVYLIPWLTCFSRKKGWYKYAGNWNQKRPPLGYAWQRWLLKRQHRIVTINGSWPGQPAHCLTFENPCLTAAEREEGREIIKEKRFSKPFQFCFAGRLEDEKGVQRILEALVLPGIRELVNKIHFVGNGDKKAYYEAYADEAGIPAVFHGFLSGDALFDIYKDSHFLLLPSTASEGFPKVIAEAMNFGCIPVVSEVSSIGQYIHTENGFLIAPVTAEGVARSFKAIDAVSAPVLLDKARNGYQVAATFTFERYRERIMNEIVNR